MMAVTDLEQRCASLEAQLALREAEIASMSAELDETNRGVVALYSELDDKAHQLAEASELKSRFLSYMSHEFRTPLGAIRSIARILADQLDGPLGEEQLRQVAFIQTSAVELTELVDDLLDLAKIEAGRVTVSPDWFNLLDLFTALRGMFRPILETNTVSLVFQPPAEFPRAFTDDKKLSQILRNFISNALKFTSAGEVRVTAELDGHGQVIFAVADSGIGIAPEYLKELFNDYVQVDSPIQKRLRGTGLGLSLSRKLAEMLGGRVWAVSEPGKGSIFHVAIPLRMGTAATTE